MSIPTVGTTPRGEGRSTDRIRVVTVTTGGDRQEHLCEATREVGGRRRYWFSTTDALAGPEPLTRPIWTVAAYEGTHALISRL